MIEYYIINSGVNNSDTTAPDEKHLVINHNAGFFSNNTIALMDIITFFNAHEELPDVVDRSAQYLHYKSAPGDNMIDFYFDCVNPPIRVPFEGDIPMPYDCMSIQFAPYSELPFDDWLPFVEKYFRPSQHVFNIAFNLGQKYKLNYDNLCAVFYRGNDKNREMSVAPYGAFIEKAADLKTKNPELRFLVQPDETEFLEAFKKAFPDSIAFDETPHMSKKDSAIFYELPIKQRAEFGATFFAALLCLSRCKHVLTHSGNLGLWTCLYRGNAENVHQIFNNKWIT